MWDRGKESKENGDNYASLRDSDVELDSLKNKANGKAKAQRRTTQNNDAIKHRINGSTLASQPSSSPSSSSSRSHSHSSLFIDADYRAETKSAPFNPRTIYDSLMLYLHTLYRGQLLAMWYLYADTRRNRRGFLIGAFTVFLVVTVVTVIQNNTMKSPIIFFKIAENNVGEIDVVATAGSSADEARFVERSALPFVNQSWLDTAMRGDEMITGSAGRWLTFATILNPAYMETRRDKVAVAVTLGIDSVREKEIGLGREWELPPLINQTCYLSRTVARQIGFDPLKAIGQTIIWRVDLFEVIAQLMPNEPPPNPNNVKDIERIIQLVYPALPPTFWSDDYPLQLQASNLPYIPQNASSATIIHDVVYSNATFVFPPVCGFYTPSTPITFTELVAVCNENGINVTLESVENLFLASGPLTDTIIAQIMLAQYNITVTNEDVLQAILPSFVNQTRIQANFTIANVVDAPYGKWPEAYGSIMIVESEMLLDVVRTGLFRLLNTPLSELFFTLDNSSVRIIQLPPISILNLLLIFSPNTTETQDNINFYTNLLNNVHANSQSLLSIIEYSDRINAYQKDLESLTYDMQLFTNSIAEDIGIRYPVLLTTPLATALILSQYVRYFLDNIFTSVVALIAFLGVLLIYALLLNDVDAKTYEYGMLRALGMTQTTLIQLLITKSFMFAIPGILVGLFIAFLINIPITQQIGYYVAVSLSLALNKWPITLAICIGIIMPLVANIVPISRALSRTLRDSLDVYHHVISEVSVRMIKLADLGMDVWQSCLSILMVSVGFITFYVVPYSFIFNNIPLFLGILNGILLGMLLGLCIIAAAIQPIMERSLLWFMLTITHYHKKLYIIISKNLNGHRKRNMKTAQMFTICLAFVIFAGAMFALQAQSLTDNLRVLLGADITVQVTGNRDLGNRLDETAMSAYLDDQKTRRANGDANAVVIDYTFVTFPMNYLFTVNGADVASLSTFHSARNLMYGVSENYLDVTYSDYYILSENSPSKTGYLMTNNQVDVVKLMYTDAGNAQLPTEISSASVPTSIAVGSNQVALNGYYNQTEQQLIVAHDYVDYIDCVIGEALRGALSVTINTALDLRVRVDGRNYNRLCKARGMVSKMPGFLYSSYRLAVAISALLMRQDQYEQLMHESQGPSSSLGSGPSPKQKLYVKVAAGSTSDQREDVMNGLRSFIQSSGILVTDTNQWIATTYVAVNLMNLFFLCIGVITMIMCFFILWLSFTANVHENAWEFGVLRALGLNSTEVLCVYVYEALTLVITSILLGTVIGLIIAASLTVQFNLFIEMPFRMYFPHTLFWPMTSIAIVCAIFGSAYPAYGLIKSQISQVLRAQ